METTKKGGLPNGRESRRPVPVRACVAPERVPLCLDRRGGAREAARGVAYPLPAGQAERGRTASRAAVCRTAVPVCVALRVGQYAAALPRGAHGMTAGRPEGRRGKKAAAAFPRRTVYIVQMIFF